ncbi:MAG: 4Fe-4S binding protein [Chloroflexi bacterium]|nr:4Fe-4S binding protein [Chloroflexota bacterium]
MLHILRASLRTGLVTTSYPRRPEAPAGRGRPVIDPSRCDCTRACADACPSGAITISRTDAGAMRWQLDLARCVFCGLCEEACQVGAIKMTPDYELAVRNRDDLIVGVTRRQKSATVPTAWASRLGPTRIQLQCKILEVESLVR